MNMYKGFFGLLSVVLLAQGCAKAKQDIPSTLTGTQVINAPASSIRLFNFTGQSLDVKVNTIPLTAFSTDANAQGNQIGLALFPANVWTSATNGSPVILPTSLENKQSSMQVIIEPRIAGFSLNGLGQTSSFYIDTTLVDDPLNPRDYYVLFGGRLQVIPRNSVSPANPQNFKIRIYNLSGPKDTMGLTGNLTLTYADGTPVSTALTSVPAGSASSYIELPYGPYQFKLYAAKPGGAPDYTKQLTELPSYPLVSNGIPEPQSDLTTMVRGYQPGGTYSILVTPNLFGWDFSGGGFATYFNINSYRVLTEQAAPTNTDWARIQGVNALSAQGVSFLVDGLAMGTNVPYGQAGDYTIVSQGTHVVTAQDAGGKVLSRQSFELYAFDNITAWAYMRNDTPGLVFSNTDLTSTLYESSASNIVDDGTSGSVNTYEIPYGLQFRFLNLSNVPYVTFTQEGNLLNPGLSGNANNELQNDTLAYPQAYINLQPGIPVTYNPFVVYPANLEISNAVAITTGGNPYPYVEGLYGNQGAAVSSPVPLRAYASEPATGSYGAQVPGAILPTVTVLTAANFASGALIYPNGVPGTENGFYTVALIGNTTVSGQGQAQMIVVKHNK